MKKVSLYFGLVLLFVSTGFTNSSKNGAELQIDFDASQSTIRINYTPQGIVYNLLIHVNDPKGRTVFLENRYNVSGNYQCSFDMKKQPKGTYLVEIIGDDKHINKQIELK